MVVVVVGNKILHRIVGEEAFELVIELSGQGLVVRQHERRPVHSLDDLGHGEGLARSRDPEQNLVLLAVVDPADEGRDGLALIPLRLVITDQFEIHGEALSR